MGVCDVWLFKEGVDGWWELELGCKREYYVVSMCQGPGLGKRHKATQIGPEFEHRLQPSAGDRSIGHIVIVMGKTILRVLKPRPTGPWPLSAVTVNFDPSRGAAAELKVREKRERKKEATPALRYEPTLNSSVKYK